LVEHQLPKLRVASSSLVCRSSRNPCPGRGFRPFGVRRACWVVERGTTAGYRLATQYVHSLYGDRGPALSPAIRRPLVYGDPLMIDGLPPRPARATRLTASLTASDGATR
jgi:hypothetical protein